MSFQNYNTLNIGSHEPVWAGSSTPLVSVYVQFNQGMLREGMEAMKWLLPQGEINS